MKDSNDNQTTEIFPTKKRGRPSTGTAMTAAERKRKSRENAKKKAEAAVVGLSKNPDTIKEIPISGLIEELQRVMAESKKNNYGMKTIKTITAELERRYSLK